MKRRLAVCLALLIAACAHGAETAAPNYDELFYRALRYGNTEQRRTEKEAARQALFAQGAQALREVMARVHVENLMLQVLAFEMVAEHVPAEEGTPVLAEFLSAPDDQTRRIAAYLLGFYPRDDAEIPALLAMLENEKQRGVALRTLGKWRVDAVRVAARELLHAESERVRIAASNALGELNNPEDIPALIEALGDSAFLVRNSAARALVRQGAPAKRPLRKALASSQGAQKRQVLRLLGALGAAPRREVKRMAQTATDPGLREDAEWVLRPEAGPWIWEEPYY